ncbi:hypothetical protein Q9966_016830 [Columba livia]|nr:hypothetical protein Q9966_016830 [Columba livia]
MAGPVGAVPAAVAGSPRGGCWGVGAPGCSGRPPDPHPAHGSVSPARGDAGGAGGGRPGSAPSCAASSGPSAPAAPTWGDPRDPCACCPWGWVPTHWVPIWPPWTPVTAPPSWTPPGGSSLGAARPPPTEPFDVVGRILTYAAGAGATHALPVAEAMLTRGDTRPDDDSYQKFVPFVAAVTVGQLDDPPAAPGDNDECPPPGLLVPSPSPPPGGGGDRGTPRSRHPPPRPPPWAAPAPRGPRGTRWRCRWITGGGAPMGAAERRREGGGAARGGGQEHPEGHLPLPARHPPAPPPATGPPPPAPALTLTLVTREKNKKVPTLFKRPREPDTKSLVVEGVTRLICAPRQPPLRVWVDGSPWDDIKFFQLAPSWPTHVKHLQVALWGPKAP